MNTQTQFKFSNSILQSHLHQKDMMPLVRQGQEVFWSIIRFNSIQMMDYPLWRQGTFMCFLPDNKVFWNIYPISRPGMVGPIKINISVAHNPASPPPSSTQTSLPTTGTRTTPCCPLCMYGFPAINTGMFIQFVAAFFSYCLIIISIVFFFLLFVPYHTIHYIMNLSELQPYRTNFLNIQPYTGDIDKGIF